MRQVIKLINLFFIISVSFILIYIFYKSEIVNVGKQRHIYLITFIIFSLLLASILINTFFFREKYEYFTLVLLAIFINIYVFEWILTSNFKIKQKKNSENKYTIYKKETGKDFEQISILEFYNKKKSKNQNVVLMMQPSEFTYKEKKIFTLGGISKKETIYCNEEGYYSTYHSDRYGFNNPDKEWDKKFISYLLVGDSYVHGACVNRPNDIASRLRNLSNKSVLNLGVSSAGPLTQFAILKEYLNKNVRNILWFYTSENDHFELKTELNNEILKSYYLENEYNQELTKLVELNDKLLTIKMNSEIEKELKKRNKIKKLHEIKQFLKISFIRMTITAFFQKNDLPIIEFKKILNNVKNLSVKNNSNLYFIYIPNFKEFQNKNYVDPNYKLVKNLTEDLNIKFIDIRKEMINEQKDPLIFFPFKQHAHFNQNGYDKISQIVLNQIKK